MQAICYTALYSNKIRKLINVSIFSPCLPCDIECVFVSPWVLANRSIFYSFANGSLLLTPPRTIIRSHTTLFSHPPSVTNPPSLYFPIQLLATSRATSFPSLAASSTNKIAHTAHPNPSISSLTSTINPCDSSGE